MQAELHWIDIPGPGRLGLMPHPHGDEWLHGELVSFQEQGATLLVSLIEKEEAADLGLIAEEALCQKIGLRYRSFPICDHSTPPLDKATFEFIEELANEVRAGEAVAVHCMAGIGRSGLITICVLITLGFAPMEAMSLASEARGFAIPETDAQCQWVRAFAQR